MATSEVLTQSAFFSLRQVCYLIRKPRNQDTVLSPEFPFTVTSLAELQNEFLFVGVSNIFPMAAKANICPRFAKN